MTSSDLTFYYAGDGWIVAKHDTWLPGIYQTMDAATRASEMNPSRLQEIWSRVRMENRPLNWRDLTNAD